MSDIASEKLQQLIDTLRSQQKWTNSQLLKLVKKLAITNADVSMYQRYNHNPKDSYGRNEIYTNEYFRVYLMSWDAADSTAIHDHGGTDWGCVQFFGEATHCSFSYDGEQLKMTDKSIIPNGEILPIVGDFIHLMANMGKESICTLHIYGMNTPTNNQEEQAKVFQPEKGRMVTTSGTAYLNMPMSAVLTSQEMPKMSQPDYQEYMNIVSPFYERIGESETVNI